MGISTTEGRPRRKTVGTRFGDVAYLEAGSGSPAVFIHGVFLSADLWQHQLDALGDLRRCLAVDLLAHGESAVPAGRKLSISLQADMVVDFLHELDLGAVDLVGNDSGGAIAQLVAAQNPQRVRTLTLTNCDVHDNWPPAAFAPIRDLAVQGLLAESLGALGQDPVLARGALASALERPEDVPDDTIRAFFGPFGSAPDRAAAVQDYVAGMDCAATIAIRDDLARFLAPTLIVWGADDAFFDVAWANWLSGTIPGTVRCAEVPGGRLLHPFERPDVLNRELRQLWSNSQAHRILNHYLDAWNRHDLDSVLSQHTEDTTFTLHPGGASHSGRDAVLAAFRDGLQAWAGAHWEPVRRTVTPEVCVLESTMTATATGPVKALGFSLTEGAAVRGRCIDVLTLNAGKITSKDTYLDVVELLSSARSAP
jgi:steroid delta-isomerase-like uncharacterized protein